MSAADIDPVTRIALAKLVRLLASDKDGEALGAVYAIRRLLRTNKRDLHDLAAIIEHARPLAPPIDDLPPWRVMLAAVEEHSARLKPKDRAFVYSLGRWHGGLSDKQKKWLADLFERVAA